MLLLVALGSFDHIVAKFIRISPRSQLNARILSVLYSHRHFSFALKGFLGHFLGLWAHLCLAHLAISVSFLFPLLMCLRLETVQYTMLWSSNRNHFISVPRSSFLPLRCLGTLLPYLNLAKNTTDTRFGHRSVLYFWYGVIHAMYVKVYIV